MCGKSIITKTSTILFLLLIWERLWQQALAYEGPEGQYLTLQFLNEGVLIQLNTV